MHGDKLVPARLKSSPILQEIDNFILSRRSRYLRRGNLFCCGGVSILHV